MRVNLITRPSGHSEQGKGSVSILLKIRPACGLPGDYEYRTESSALLLMLQEKTELPSSILRRFEQNLRDPRGARLLGVDLSDSVLTEIGYFID